MRIEQVWSPLAYQLPKRDRSLEECEDAWGASPDGYVLAVADGASESAYARLWAQLLVRSFVERPTMDIDAAWVMPAARSFGEAIAATLPVPWYVAEKLARGTFATLLGVVLAKDTASFSVVAVGDSLLAWCTPHRHEGSLPAASLEDMAAYPYLVSTLTACNAELSTHAVKHKDYHLPHGDTFLFLMTDAIGRWYLRELHEGKEPWRQLLKLGDQAAFAHWASDNLGSGRLKDDDLTLIIVRVTSR